MEARKNYIHKNAHSTAADITLAIHDSMTCTPPANAFRAAQPPLLSFHGVMPISASGMHAYFRHRAGRAMQSMLAAFPLDFGEQRWL